jgi:PAS domain S-box-containing protein
MCAVAQMGASTSGRMRALKASLKIVVSFVAATLLVALAAGASLHAVRNLELASEAKEYTAGLLVRSAALLASLGNAERSQRDHALTADDRFLAAYVSERDRIPVALEELRALTESRPSLASVEELQPLIAAKLAQLAAMVELRRKEGADAVVTALTAERERKASDAIHSAAARFTQAEAGVLDRERAEFTTYADRLFAIILVICGLALLLPISFSYQIYESSQSRTRDLVHVETQRLLEVEENSNRRLQQANSDLQASEEKLAVTLNSIDDAVIATDAGALVTLLNPLAEKLTGWTQAQALGHPVEEIFRIIDAESRQALALPVRQTLEQGLTLSLADQTRIVARDGTECDIADSCAPIRGRDGQVVGAVLVFRDVTERKRLDEAIHAKNAELEAARSVADKANLAKSEFLSSMSHELRTPLSAILGFAQLVDSGQPPPTPAQKRSLDQILKAGWYLLDLINEILDLALIESGRLSLSMEPMSLADVMRECELMIETQARARGVSARFPHFAGPTFVMADRTRVKQVLINLLSNAIKYNSAGGTIDVSYAATAPRRIRVSVRDTGRGLTPEKLNQLFQPFNRLGQEQQGAEGTGIGLVMCKRLIELMGGSIGVESTVGSGSVFWIELDESEAPRPVATAKPLMTAGGLQRDADTHTRVLLYVEDNPANLMLVEDIIARRQDIRMLSAPDGITGVKMALANQPDVILMDINLPGISGTEAMLILAADPATAQIPVVALSANAMPRDIAKGLEHGFFRYLTKPIKVAEFLETLDLALTHASLSTSAETEKPNR